MLLVLGIALFVVSGILIVIWVAQRRKLGSLARAEVTTIGQLAGLANAVNVELERAGTGAGFSQLVGLSGQVRADDPLTSELAGERCVYYDYTVEREFEETYQETDSSTNQRVTKTRTRTETVAHGSRRTKFQLDDGTGTLTVDPEGASIESVQVVERYEPAPVGGGSIRIGPVTLGWDAPGLGSRRTLGYRYRERVLPLGSSVFVLGMARGGGAAGLNVRKPDTGDRFLVSLKTREELVGSTRRAVTWLLIASIALDAAGVVLVLLEVLRG